MALDNFKAPPLPNPAGDYDPQYMRQLIRALEIYFSQLDSNTPNNAQKYTATNFVWSPVVTNYTTAQKNALKGVLAGTLVFDTTLNKLCVYAGTAWQTVTST